MDRGRDASRRGGNLSGFVRADKDRQIVTATATIDAYLRVKVP
jgi:hypothetical protein